MPSRRSSLMDAAARNGGSDGKGRRRRSGSSRNVPAVRDRTSVNARDGEREQRSGGGGESTDPEVPGPSRRREAPSCAITAGPSSLWTVTKPEGGQRFVQFRSPVHPGFA